MKHPFHAYPVHLYHAEKAPVIAQNAEDEATALAAGYSETYVPQEYPKMVNGVTANNAAEEAKLLGTAPPAEGKRSRSKE